MSSDLVLTLRGRGDRTFNPEEQLWVSRAGVEIPRWMPAAAVFSGDCVGITYGGELPTTAPAIPELPDRPLYGNENVIAVPKHLNHKLGGRSPRARPLAQRPSGPRVGSFAGPASVRALSSRANDSLSSLTCSGAAHARRTNRFPRRCSPRIEAHSLHSCKESR